MTDEEIKEGNELIARFLGYELITPAMRRNPEQWTASYWQKDHPRKQTVLCREGLLRYNAAWSWLMPVVKQCNEIVVGLKLEEDDLTLLTENIFNPEATFNEFMDADIQAIFE